VECKNTYRIAEILNTIYKTKTMGKKSLDNKAARKFIVEARENGKTDQEIYNELSQQYYDKKHIALLITGTVTKENKNKYKVYNNILLILLGLAILSRIIYVLGMTVQTGQPLILLLVFIVPIFTAYFAYEIARYNGQIYRICGIMAIVGFLQSFKVSEGIVEFAINLFFAAAVAGLSFYLESNMFPHYGNKNLIKDTNGDYILK